VSGWEPPGGGPWSKRPRPKSAWPPAPSPQHQSPAWAWPLGIIAVGLLVVGFVVGNLTYRPSEVDIYDSTECGSTFLPRFVSTFSRGRCDAAMDAARYVTIGLCAAATLVATVGSVISNARGPGYETARRSLLVIAILACLFLCWTLVAWAMSELAAYEPS
jgi:hypothetical protein